MSDTKDVVMTEKKKRYMLDPSWEEKLELVRAKIGTNLTRAEFAMVIHLAKKYDLDPLADEINALKFYSTKKQKWYPASISISRNGYLSIAHASGVFDGLESGMKDGSETIAYCRVWRKDMKYPFYYEAYMEEYKRGEENWAKRPKTMLIKCAEHGCLRRAFSIHGAYSKEEYIPGVDEEDEGTIKVESDDQADESSDGLLPEQEPARFDEGDVEEGEFEPADEDSEEDSNPQLPDTDAVNGGDDPFVPEEGENFPPESDPEPPKDELEDSSEPNAKKTKKGSSEGFSPEKVLGGKWNIDPEIAHDIVDMMIEKVAQFGVEAVNKQLAFMDVSLDNLNEISKENAEQLCKRLKRVADAVGDKKEKTDGKKKTSKGKKSSADKKRTKKDEPKTESKPKEKKESKEKSKGEEKGESEVLKKTHEILLKYGKMRTPEDDSPTERMVDQLMLVRDVTGEDLDELEELKNLSMDQLIAVGRECKERLNAEKKKKEKEEKKEPTLDDLPPKDEPDDSGEELW